MDAAELAAYIAALVDAAPPMTAQQSENVSALLRSQADDELKRSA